MKTKSAVHGAEPPQNKGKPQKQQLTGAVRKPEYRPAHMHRDVGGNKFAQDKEIICGA